MKTLEDFRSLIGEVVDRVSVAPAARRGGRFDPRRVSMQWRKQ